MKYKQLGTTDMTVSVLAIGCWPFSGGSVWGEQEDQDSVDAVHTALDLGINFFDTAEAYGRGHAEEVLGRALQGRRDEAVIASKVSRGHLRPEEVFEACEGSLRRLQTDYIDLYQVHWPNWKIPLDETWEAMQTLKQQGKVRAISVCNFGAQDLGDLLELGRPETNQLPYSLLWRAIEFEILPKCRQEGIGILPYSPLAQGLLTGKFESVEDVPPGRRHTRFYSGDRPAATRHTDPGQEELTFATIDRLREICDGIGESMTHVALAWLLHKPLVTSVLVGVRNPSQVRDNAQAAQVELSRDTLAQLDEAAEELKQALGTNPDMYQTEGRFR